MFFFLQTFLFFFCNIWCISVFLTLDGITTMYIEFKSPEINIVSLTCKQTPAFLAADALLTVAASSSVGPVYLLRCQLENNGMTTVPVKKERNAFSDCPQLLLLLLLLFSSYQRLVMFSTQQQTLSKPGPCAKLHREKSSS